MSILQDLSLIFALSLVVAFVCIQIKLPPLVGYLLTGVALGPHGLGLIHGVEEVEVMAEIGVILLLFAIGLEFSFQDLKKIRREVFLGGSLQMALTLVLVFALCLPFGFSFQGALFLGLMVALSSTAIVLKVFGEKGWMESPHGRAGLAILIYQDLALVPLMLLIPYLAGRETGGLAGLGYLGLKILALGLGVYLLTRYLVPKFLYQIAKTRSRELFLLTVITLGLGVAWGTNLAGLSLGLGAFLAGLIIAESEYSTYALSNILPFRDIFSAFFFISIGMLLNLGGVWAQAPVMLGLTLLVLLVKSIGIGITGWWLKLSTKTTAILMLSLAQVGEFSFVLAKSGLEQELLDRAHYELFLGVTVLTLALTPILINFAPKFAQALHRRLHLEKSTRSEVPTQWVHGRNHLIIIGFGVTGQMLAKAAQTAGASFIILEMNAETVRREKAKGLPIHFGDSAQEEVLRHLGVTQASMMTVAISDPLSSLATIRLAKKLNPALYVIARTRFVSQQDLIYQAGADEVVTTEYEGAVEIFARVLNQLLIPQDKIEAFVAQIRADGYQMLRKPGEPTPSHLNLKSYLSGLEIRRLRVSERLITCQSLKDLELRSRYGVTVLAVGCAGQLRPNPSAQTPVCPGDELVMIGEPQQLAQAALYLCPAEEPEP